MARPTEAERLVRPVPGSVIVYSKEVIPVKPVAGSKVTVVSGSAVGTEVTAVPVELTKVPDDRDGKLVIVAKSRVACETGVGGVGRLRRADAVEQLFRHRRSKIRGGRFAGYQGRQGAARRPADDRERKVADRCGIRDVGESDQGQIQRRVRHHLQRVVLADHRIGWWGRYFARIVGIDRNRGDVELRVPITGDPERKAVFVALYGRRVGHHSAGRHRWIAVGGGGID